MPQISAAHRRLIRRRVLAELSSPSPPREMGKKKAKKPSPSKPPKSSSASPPSKNSSSPSTAHPVQDEIADLPSPASVEVSDALQCCKAVEVAQPTRDIADPRPALTESASEKTVIVANPTDPSTVEANCKTSVTESSPVAQAESSSVPLQAQPEALQALAVAGASETVADAVAKETPLSSQNADTKVPSPVINEEMMTSNTTGVSLDSTVEADPKNTPAITQETTNTSWCDRTKGVKQLSKKGEAFTLPSGEACIKIPNSVIEKNRKSWEPFVLGQFYSDPPSQGTLHNIVNGIWSKNYRDISVSKMEGFSFLFRIPNAATRSRVIKQKLWQIEGQTMFVDKWEPGVVPTKPELTSAPIWLELRNVPFQFFNEDGLERIASLVGHPKFLHPATANKTNLEVAKVFTIIDPRKPLPEAVNVQFDSGVISRVLVSSPWMPPVCEFCKEIGHSTRRCPTAPKPCSFCSASDHVVAKCPKAPKKEVRGRKTRRSRSRAKQQWMAVDNSVPPTNQTVMQVPLTMTDNASPPLALADPSLVVTVERSKLGTVKDKMRGESSTSATRRQLPRSASGTERSSQSDMQADSSDVESSDSELEEGEFSKHEPDFELVRNRKRFSGQKGKRGKGPKIN